MTSGRWRQIEDLFHQALEQEDSARDRWLAEACRGDVDLLHEVAALVAMDQRGSGVETHVQNAVTALAGGPQRLERLRIGPYELIEEIGRGGMGSVYRARRADEEYQSEVAIKLVHQGMDTEFVFGRFLRERQVLARLQHPNIAQLLDGGHTSGGVPYIVMEYIRGTMINDYCRERQLDVRARLRTFLPVCAAVEYSHRNFVVHRDLKPGNILVSDMGTPKLLDFGICRLLQDAPDLTQGASMMTPDYASPEQVRGEPAGVASDIYSLGAVLYEILTERRPHRFAKMSAAEIERVICEETVSKPSAATTDRARSRTLEGDLDLIVLKAMDKDPERRYATVEQLAEDIRRYLDRRPIAARSDTLAYRTGRFARRHQRAILAGAAVLASLAGTAMVSYRHAQQSDQRLRDSWREESALLLRMDDALGAGSSPARAVVAARAAEMLGRPEVDAPAIELAARFGRSAAAAGQGGEANEWIGRLRAVAKRSAGRARAQALTAAAAILEATGNDHREEAKGAWGEAAAAWRAVVETPGAAAEDRVALRSAEEKAR